MDINCYESERLMDKIFEGTKNKKAYNKAVRLIRKHCKTCELCKIKFYNFGNINVDLSEDEIRNIALENEKVDKRARLRKTIITVSSIVLSIALVFGVFSVFTIKGKNVGLASENYGVAETYDESTPEHPSYDEVQLAFQKSKEYFENVGKGAILLSLSYNDELTYSENYKDTIVVDIVYYRLFVSQGTSDRTNFINDKYSILVKHFDNDVWYAYKTKKTK